MFFHVSRRKNSYRTRSKWKQWVFCWKLTITNEKVYTEITTKQEGRLGEAKHGPTRNSQFVNNKKLLQTFGAKLEKTTKIAEFSVVNGSLVRIRSWSIIKSLSNISFLHFVSAFFSDTIRLLFDIFLPPWKFLVLLLQVIAVHCCWTLFESFRWSVAQSSNGPLTPKDPSASTFQVAT